MTGDTRKAKGGATVSTKISYSSSISRIIGWADHFARVGLLLRGDNAESADEYPFERSFGGKLSHRFFFGPSTVFRAGGGSEDSDGTESSDVDSVS